MYLIEVYLNEKKLVLIQATSAKDAFKKVLSIKGIKGTGKLAKITKLKPQHLCKVSIVVLDNIQYQQKTLGSNHCLFLNSKLQGYLTNNLQYTTMIAA